MKHEALKITVVVALVWMISGCGSFGMFTNGRLVDAPLTRHHQHDLAQDQPDAQRAKVFFIRPQTEHVQGYPDNDLAVDLDGQPLLSLAKGEYTVLYLSPRTVSITMRNLTQTRGRWEVEELKRSGQFELKPGQTYYILAHNVDGEFRGVHFEPKSIPVYEAREIARHLVPYGRARKQHAGTW